MRKPRWSSLLLFVALLLNTVVLARGQSQEDIKRGKETYQKDHPNVKTYFIEEFVGVFDPADSIMPKAKAVTHEKWKDVGGAVFGRGVPFPRPKNAVAIDEFTASYFQHDDFKQIVLRNLSTDPSAFQQFMDTHREKGFYNVTVWKAGYLMFMLLEGRDEGRGINYIIVPVNPKLFDEAKAFKKSR